MGYVLTAHEKLPQAEAKARDPGDPRRRRAAGGRPRPALVPAPAVGRHAPAGDDRERALCRPRLLIADEPTTALDVTIEAQILRLIRRLQEERGFSVLFITHDLGVVRSVSDRVVVLYAGRVAEAADTPSLFATPEHPYTRGLMAAVPQLGTPRRAALASIPGTVPADVGTLVGCAFAERCPIAIDRCRVERPLVRDLGAGHVAACHLAGAAVVS